MQQYKTAIDCDNFFISYFFSNVTPTLFSSTVAIEVVSVPPIFLAGRLERMRGSSLFSSCTNILKRLAKRLADDS